MGRRYDTSQKQYIREFLESEKKYLNTEVEELINIHKILKTPNSNKTILAPDLEIAPQYNITFSIKNKKYWFSIYAFIIGIYYFIIKEHTDIFIAITLIPFLITCLLVNFLRVCKERKIRKKEIDDIKERNINRQLQWEQELLDTTKKLEVALNHLEWPRETNISYELENDILWLDVDLPEVEDMPTMSWEIRKSGLGLDKKERSERQIRKDYATHIHGICLVLCSEAFWAMDSLQKIYCSGYTQRRNSETGYIEDEYILSICMTNEEWKKITSQPKENINPIDSINSLHLVRRDMTKSFIMKEVLPFEK